MLDTTKSMKLFIVSDRTVVVIMILCFYCNCIVGVANLLLEYGANINTHSNEFKESALTLACYKGHLGMVKFLLGAGTYTCMYSTCVNCALYIVSCNA